MMVLKPLIGISCSFDQPEGRFFLSRAYVDSVVAAGGIPVILPGPGSIAAAAPYFKAIRGLILAGGGDVDPSYFNEEPAPGLGEISPERDRFEIMLIRAALRRNIPVLGICRGIQILNVACGGKVIQHIPREIRKPLKHCQSAPRWHATHKISIAQNTLLAEILGAGPARVNSFHHQAVREPAPGFRICAVSSDGVIEGIEHIRRRFVLGVQWHPECMTEKDRKSRLLFKAFIREASTAEGSRQCKKRRI